MLFRSYCGTSQPKVPTTFFFSPSSAVFRGTRGYDGFDVQVLQVAARELLVGNDLDLAIGLLGDLDVVAEVAGAALNLDAVVKELLEGLDVEDLVVDGLRAVDDELLGDLLALLGRGTGSALLHRTLAYCSVRGSAVLNQADSKAVYVLWQAF